jgi:uncharacterized protein YqgV (UPF0045/DUF77 family)
LVAHDTSIVFFFAPLAALARIAGAHGLHGGIMGAARAADRRRADPERVRAGGDPGHPAGTADDRYKHVDAAIAVIQASGLRYEVHGLGTVVEGPPEKVWPLLQAVHQATLEAGAERTLSIIKVSSGAQAGGPRVEDLVRKFRN